MNIYNNYHKHDHISNIITIDTVTKTKDYLERIKELGYGSYFTTNHGTGGDIFESMSLCEKYGIHCKYGIEGYIVPDPSEKDDRNYHIVIIPKTNQARKKLNIVSSKAHITGYYYKPRMSPKDLLELNPHDYYITTACMGGFTRDEDGIRDIFIPLVEHFKENMLIEIQGHDNKHQIEHNRRNKIIADYYNLDLIVANDSHYIYPEDKIKRAEFLKGKDIKHGSEDSFVLDFPDYDTLYKRIERQRILSSDEIHKAIQKTLIFEECEDVYVDKSIKMPSIYPDFTPDEKITELKKHVSDKFKRLVEIDEIPKEMIDEYAEGIKQEMQVIEDTKEINTSDYFLFNEKLVDIAVNKYGGILTRTGRGSCGGFYINRLLEMTQLDRFQLDIKLYPERFMSTARLLENRALPDIDFNIVEQEPFIRASKDLLGENGCYPMIAYGTMQLSDAFRNICRARDIPFVQFNEVAKNIDEYRTHDKWRTLIKEAEEFINTIISSSVHPCAFLLDNKDLVEEYGVVRSKDNICVMVTSDEADEYKMLKDDFLIVAVWKLIYETFRECGQEILPVKELLSKLDDNVYRTLHKGLTCTLNQVDGEWATSLIKQYKPKNVSEMAMFVACLRPFFNSWRDKFINRADYTTGSTHLDEVLSSTNGYILFQENLMQYFEWLGVTPAESIGLIKKISKKKIKQEDFDTLENRIKKSWVEKTGSMDMFHEIWSMIQECMAYGFCSAHGVATGIDCLYGAYLKTNYPLEYYTVALNHYVDSLSKTTRLTDELEYFNIKLRPIEFGKSLGKYTYDRENRVIYKGIASIKHCNSKIANELMELSKNQYNSFVDLLDDIKTKTSVNKTQIKILIILNFFSMFGNNAKLLKINSIHETLYDKKQFKKDDLSKYGVSEYLAKKYADKETPKLFKNIDMRGLINELVSNIPNKPLNVTTQIAFEKENLGYALFTCPGISNDYYIILDFKTFKNETRPYFVARRLSDGEEIRTRIKQSKVFKNNPFGENSVVRIPQFTECYKKRPNADGKWVETDEVEYVVNEVEVIKNS